MKAILTPDGLSVLRIVSDDTPSRPSVTRRYVDDTGTLPAVDPATQRREVSYAIGPEEVVASWVVVALTPAEVTARQDGASDEAAVTTLRNARAVLEAGNATARQVQEVLARIVRLLIRKLLGGEFVTARSGR